MDQTILTEILAFITGSMASGLTWDLIKSAGKGIFDSFKTIFANKRYFKDASDAEKFLQSIAEKEAYNTDEPLKDAEALYKKISGQQNSQEFINELVEWLKENQTQFVDLLKQSGQTGKINIKNQTAKDNATITNIGTQINNK